MGMAEQGFSQLLDVAVVINGNLLCVSGSVHVIAIGISAKGREQRYGVIAIKGAALGLKVWIVKTALGKGVTTGSAGCLKAGGSSFMQAKMENNVLRQRDSGV